MNAADREQILKELAVIQQRLARISDELNLLNITFDLAKEPEVRLALEWFRKKLWPTSKVPLSVVAKDVLLVALTRPAELKAWSDVLVAYRDSEGFVGEDCDLKVTNAMIASRKQYRQRRAKLNS